MKQLKKYRIIFRSKMANLLNSLLKNLWRNFSSFFYWGVTETINAEYSKEKLREISEAIHGRIYEYSIRIIWQISEWIPDGWRTIRGGLRARISKGIFEKFPGRIANIINKGFCQRKLWRILRMHTRMSFWKNSWTSFCNHF